MPFVTEYSDGARFTLRVRSSLASNRRVRWFNTWEIRAMSSGDLTELTAMADAMIGFHVQVSYNYVYADEITVSSWEPDSHPYNPLGFVTFPLNQVGARAIGGDSPMPLRQTLFLKRAVTSGLLGKLFLRGALSLPDMEYQDGEWGLDNPGGLQTVVNTAIGTSGIDSYLEGIEGAQFSLCMLTALGGTRFYDNLLVAGTSDVKLNHKYFDRAP